MTLHLEHIAHLHVIDLLPIAQAHDLVECAQQLKRVFQNLALLRGPANVGDDAGEEVEGLDVLEDVRRLVGDEEDVEVF